MTIHSYTNPGWNNGGSPYISATNLNNISNALEEVTSALQTVPIENGGTGATTASAARSSLGITYANLGTVGVANGGTGLTTLTSGSALIGNGTSAVSLRAITDNTTATAVSASTNLITANTLYYHKGNSNIVTVGTITSGTWNGTAVAVKYGGTGATTAAGARTNLEITPANIGAKATGTEGVGTGGTGRTTLTTNAVLAGNGTSAIKMVASANGALYATTANGALSFGTLPAAQGGTGYTTLQATRNAMGLGNTTGALPVANGGTGATTISGARDNLHIIYMASKPAYTSSYAGYILLVPVS